MSIQTVLIKFGCVGLVSLGLTACSSMPSMDGVFVDQKESYKKAHVLPSLEMPPELSAGSVKNEYDGGTSSEVTAPKTNTVVKVTPLESEVTGKAELFSIGNVSYLVVNDNMRNAWRKVTNALEELDYDVEDKNREEGLIYLNIADENGDSNMLSSLSFWKSKSTSVYLIEFEQHADGVAVKVQNKEGVLVNNDVSKQIYADLLTKLAP